VAPGQGEENDDRSQHEMVFSDGVVFTTSCQTRKARGTGARMDQAEGPWQPSCRSSTDLFKDSGMGNATLRFGTSVSACRHFFHGEGSGMGIAPIAA